MRCCVIRYVRANHTLPLGMISMKDFVAALASDLAKSKGKDDRRRHKVCAAFPHLSVLFRAIPPSRCSHLKLIVRCVKRGFGEQVIALQRRVVEIQAILMTQISADEKDDLENELKAVLADIEKKTRQLAEVGLTVPTSPMVSPRPNSPSTNGSESNGNGSAPMDGGEYEEEFSNPLNAKRGMALGDVTET